MVDPSQQIQTAVHGLRDVLGDDLLGVYLHGSSVLGGLRPHSDIDLIAITSRPMSASEKRDVLGRLLAISRAGHPERDCRPIELFVLVESQVRPWRYPPELDLLYGDWWRAEYERGEFPWQSPNPDLTIQIDIAVRADRPLLGPPIRELLDPVPGADVRRAMMDSLPELLSYLDGDEANVILTFARTWFGLATGAIAPKDVAADWAIEQLPPEAGDSRAVLAHARSIYVGEAMDDWAGLLAAVRPCVDQMLSGIHAVEAAPVDPKPEGLTRAEAHC